MNAEGGERMEVHVCWRWKLVTFHRVWNHDLAFTCKLNLLWDYLKINSASLVIRILL